MDKKMDILYLHQYFNTPEMVGSIRSYEMSIRFLKNGNKVTIITSNREKNKYRKLYQYINGLKVCWIPVKYTNSMNKYQRIIAFMKFSLYSIIFGMIEKPDIVFATSTPLTIGIPAIIISKIKRIPLVFEVRDLWPEVPIDLKIIRNKFIIKILLFYEKYIYKNSKYVVALSEGMKEGIKKCGYPESRIIVAPNSCDIELFKYNKERVEKFKEKYRLDGKIIITYTGTIGYANNVSYLFPIIKEINLYRNDIIFLIIGDGAEKQKIINLAKKYNLENNSMLFLENVKKSEVVDIVNASDLMVSLFRSNKSLEANSANKFFDSLAASKPIIINYGGWQKNIIEKYKIGVVLDYDISKSVEKLLNFIDDKNSIRNAVDNAKKLAKTKYDRNIISNIVENTLKDAIRRK